MAAPAIPRVVIFVTTGCLLLCVAHAFNIPQVIDLRVVDLEPETRSLRLGLRKRIIGEWARVVGVKLTAHSYYVIMGS
jgi:hypothetical protein